MERRTFVKTAALSATVAALPKFGFARVFGSDRIKVGLVGCGGRGTAAICNMISADKNVAIVAVADLFADKHADSIKKISDHAKKLYPSEASDIVNADKIKKFAGWDCIDQLLAEDVDLVVDATPPVFRTPHYAKIVAAGKHAFLEKPACVDVTQAREMFAISAKAKEKGLSVVCGTQRRYHEGYCDVIKRVQDGEIGEIVSAQCFWLGSYYVGQALHDNFAKSGVLDGLEPDDIEYQIRNWPSFIWTSGDNIVEQHVHNIDVIMWALGDKRMPVDVRGLGGRGTDLPSPTYGDRFTNFSVDFDFGDGLRLASYCQQDPGCSDSVGERIIGTKGIMITQNYGGVCRLTDRQGKPLYTPSTDIPQCIEMEHKFLLDSIRAGRRVNTLDTLVNSTLLAVAGRMSAYSGKKFKFEWLLRKSRESLVPANVDLMARTQDLRVKNKSISVPVIGKYPLV